jgi:predicted amidohydrolase
MRAGLIQMRSTEDREENLRSAEALCREAAFLGADLVALPENFSFVRSTGTAPSRPEPLDGPLVARFGALARELRIWLLLGSVPETISPDHPRVYNTAVFFDRAGEIRAVYRKIHLFDIHMPGGPSIRESETIEAGERVVVADSEFGKVGLSICYDLRFPELYRWQARSGARLLLVPSAFTERTGRDHWHVLARARAVENLCFLLAPAQWGQHGGRRSSYGHTLIVDPWGRVVAEKAEGEGVLEWEVDLEEVDRVRATLPALDHARAWLLGKEDA